MTQSEHLLAVLAALYCFALGAIALQQSRGSRSHLLFAGYNFANGLWNFGDIFLLAKRPADWGWLHQYTRLSGIWIVPFLVDFSYELARVAKKPSYRLATNIFYGLAVGLTLLAQTPYLNVGALKNPVNGGPTWNNPGPLYPLFMAFMFGGVLAVIIPLALLLKSATGIVRKRILYILLAITMGAVALTTFFISFVSANLPWLYFPIQILMGFIFAYAIFQHNLLVLNVALRRTALVVGLYAFIGTVLGALLLIFYRTMQATGRVEVGTFLALVLVVIAISSLGPWIYSLLVRRLTIFHERTASELTHEFKTPLSAIQSAKSIVEEELEKPTPDINRVRDYLGMIQRNSERMDRFVHQILALSKGGAGSTSGMTSDVDLATLAKDVIALFPNDAHRIRLEGNGAHVMGVEEGLRHVITNLVANAVAYAPTGAIVIRLVEEGEQLLLSITDAGVGMTSTDLDRLFTPFQRGKSATGKGTGLGLVIAKRWVEAHQGRIWAESPGEGKGSTFCVSLPRN